MSESFIRDNPQQPGMSAQVYIPDQLIADARNLVTQPILLGAGLLKRGTVLGQQTVNPVQPVPGANNAGDGALGAISVGSAVQVGSYTLTAVDATNFTVTNPEGTAIGTATVGAPFAGNEVGFTLTAGATAFAAGDSFVINVFDAVGTYVACVRTATDGSQNPVAILADDADATAGPVTTGGYLAGEFNDRALTFDASWTLQQLVAAMRPYGLFAKTSMSAASPANNTAP